MTPADLQSLRKSLNLTQAQMAQRMGLGLRAYQEIEAGDEAIRERHRLLVERVALTEAVAQKNPMLAPARIRAEALDLAALIRTE